MGRCTSVAWVPEGNGTFAVAHADGNLYVYEKGKDGTGDSSFPAIRDQTQFSVTHAKSSKIVKLLAYGSDKDLFAEFYRKKLSWRLLFDKSANDDHERSILTKLKQ